MTNRNKNGHTSIAKDNKGRSKLTGHQIDKLKLLGAHPLFQKLISDFRKQFNIDIRTMVMDITGSGESAEKIVERICNDLEEIGRRFQMFGMEMQFYRYARCDLWEFDPAFPKKFMNEALTIPRKYEITHKLRSIDTEGDETDERVIEHPASVSLVTYARLTFEEERTALSELKQAQKKYFTADLVRQTRMKPRIDRDLSIVEPTTTSTQPRRKEILKSGSYLAILKASVDRGENPRSAYKTARRAHPEDIGLEKACTSSDVAIKKFGAKKYAGKIRQIKHRTGKRLQELS